MLHAMAFYAGFGLDLTARGDLNVDGHHTVEDTGIVLGQAIREALGDKRGIRRFGSAYVPMDEALAFTSLDFSAAGHASSFSRKCSIALRSMRETWTWLTPSTLAARSWVSPL